MSTITEQRKATPSPADVSDAVIRHATLRGVGFVGMLGIVLIHLLDVIGKMGETPYLGVMYIALMVASFVVAGMLLHTGSRGAWMLAGGLAAATLLGFVLSRTTGLPDATGDIGNWSEPLGLASMLVEAAVIAVSVYALTAVPRRAERGRR